MAKFKYKEGDFVEVIKTSKGKNNGHRFFIANMKLVSFSGSDKKEIAYETDIMNVLTGRNMWSPESWLKLINQDINDISNSTFHEILNGIKSTSLNTAARG